MRLLQTFAALCFTSPAGPLFFWLIGLSLVAALVVFGVVSKMAAVVGVGAYLCSVALYNPQFGRGWPFHWFLYSRFVDWVLGYYDSTCIREGPPLDPDGHYLFAMAPHGILGVCRAFSGGTLWRSLYPGVDARCGSFGGAFKLPGVREFSLSCGCLDAGRPTLTRAIQRGENIMLLPGGFQELLLTDGTSTTTQLVLLERTGFVRLAIEHGLDLVPGFCFGEKWVHDPVLLPKPLRRQLYRRFRLAGALPIGRWGTFLGKIASADGKPLSLGYVWGAPIRVTRQAEPTAAYIAEVHAAYVREVRRIFETYKARFGYAEAETLELVSAKSTKAA